MSNLFKFAVFLCLGAGWWLIPLNGCGGGQLVQSSRAASPEPDYLIDLAWQAPDSFPESVLGYNIYRSADGGGTYQKLNGSPVSQTSYTDTNVQGGLVYLYLVESVDAAGVESAPSNMAVVTIP